MGREVQKRERGGKGKGRKGGGRVGWRRGNRDEGEKTGRRKGEEHNLKLCLIEQRRAARAEQTLSGSRVVVE